MTLLSMSIARYSKMFTMGLTASLPVGCSLQKEKKLPAMRKARALTRSRHTPLYCSRDLVEGSSYYPVARKCETRVQAGRLRESLKMLHIRGSLLLLNEVKSQDNFHTKLECNLVKHF
jgi:hypothetical protein